MTGSSDWSVRCLETGIVENHIMFTHKSLSSQTLSASEDFFFSYFIFNLCYFLSFALPFPGFFLVETLFFVCSAMVAIADHTYFSFSVDSTKKRVKNASVSVCIFSSKELLGPRCSEQEKKVSRSGYRFNPP